MFYNQSIDGSIKIPIAKNSGQEQLYYIPDQKVTQFHTERGGGKYGADLMLYEDDQDKCHAKYLLFKHCDEIVGINRLSEKTDKIPLIWDNKVTIKRQYRRTN